MKIKTLPSGKFNTFIGIKAIENRPGLYYCHHENARVIILVTNSYKGCVCYTLQIDVETGHIAPLPDSFGIDYCYYLYDDKIEISN